MDDIIWRDENGTLNISVIRFLEANHFEVSPTHRRLVVRLLVATIIQTLGEPLIFHGTGGSVED